MTRIFSQDKTALGLDISDVSLKFVQFSGTGNARKIAAYTDELIPPGVMAGDVIRDPKKLIEVIKRAVAHPKFGKISTPYVIASLPETKCFVRVIQMQEMSEEEAVEAVPWEAEAYIPIPIGQVYLDWEILPAPVKDNKMTVLITAAPRDYVDDFTRILKEAGLAPLALEVESQSTARSLVSHPEETVLILDINALRSSFIIYDAGALQFTSSIPIAGKVFTETLARAMGLESLAAEKLKRERGVCPELEPTLYNLSAEIKNTIRFYEEHAGADKKISRVLLSGSSSKLKGLPEFLAKALAENAEGEHPLRSLANIKVELGDPWKKIGPQNLISPLDSLSYATAVGLAMREEN